MQPGDILSLVGAFAMFILVLVLAAWSVRLLGRGYAIQNKGKMIEIVERVGLGTDKQLLIVKAADRAFLIGVTGQHIEKIEELDPASLPPGDGEPGRDSAFLNVFKHAFASKAGKEGGNEQGADTHGA